ncbi:SDR family oxidoreductase [Hyphobacterium marinum]|uniref:SDR family oxidoreductase n=1 Tax=Hyphobacterium marinum TaxID=3116574 RepID=A0ABU7LUV1_9PROT|nr:SDR family oxidoreductase [Hyphobacterium sp. Y6023]MEE2565327.1 SDR family oxidoreductase [Hyphobacterium sp. Y6023]
MTCIVITGANRGIGLEHARLWLETGAEVHAACRTPDRADALKALDPGDGQLTVHAYDAAAPEAGKALAAAVGKPVDVLLANAGVMGPRDGQSLGNTDPGAWVDTLKINALGPLLLAEAFADLLAASKAGKLVLQSSRMGSISDNTSGGYYIYRASKAALNATGRSLAIDLKPHGIAVAILHPGWVRTDMGGSNGLISARESAETEKALIEALTLENTGEFRHQSGEFLAW